LPIYKVRTKDTYLDPTDDIHPWQTLNLINNENFRHMENNFLNCAGT